MDVVDLPPAAIAARSPSPALRGFARRSIEFAYGPTWRARSSALPPKPPVAKISDRARIVVRPPLASTTAAETSPSRSTAIDSSAASVLTRPPPDSMAAIRRAVS